jgi:hypothetical protein
LQCKETHPLSWRQNFNRSLQIFWDVEYRATELQPKRSMGNIMVDKIMGRRGSGGGEFQPRITRIFADGEEALTPQMSQECGFRTFVEALVE